MSYIFLMTDDDNEHSFSHHAEFDAYATEKSRGDYAVNNPAECFISEKLR